MGSSSFSEKPIYSSLMLFSSPEKKDTNISLVEFEHAGLETLRRSSLFFLKSYLLMLVSIQKKRKQDSYQFYR